MDASTDRYGAKSVLMDLDGTLADTATDMIAALNRLCAEQGRPALDYQRARPRVSKGARALIRFAFGESLDEAAETDLTTRFLEHYAKTRCQNSVLFDGMTELIEHLNEQHLPWGIVTNKPSRFTTVVVRTLLMPHPPHCVISGDTLEHCKPHPAPLLEAAKQINMSAEHCLFLGDDIRDMQAARAAGMTGIIATFGYIEPGTDLADWDADGTIDHPMELTPWLAT